MEIIRYEADNNCENDFIICEGDCTKCPNKDYFKIWEIMSPKLGTRPNFVIIEETLLPGRLLPNEI